MRGSLGARRRSRGASSATFAGSAAALAGVETDDSITASSVAACTASATDAASDEGRTGATKLSSMPTITEAGMTNSAALCCGAVGAVAVWVADSAGAAASTTGLVASAGAGSMADTVTVSTASVAGAVVASPVAATAVASPLVSAAGVAGSLTGRSGGRVAATVDSASMTVSAVASTVTAGNDGRSSRLPRWRGRGWRPRLSAGRRPGRGSLLSMACSLSPA